MREPILGREPGPGIELEASRDLQGEIERRLSSPAPAIAGEFQGVWKREWIEREGGGREGATDAVFWFQAGSHFGDIRIPSDLFRLREASTGKIPALMAQQSFAGVTTITESADEVYCNWNRLLSFQPIEDAPDHARLSLADTGDRIIETGLDKSYRESWYRLPVNTADRMVLELIDVKSGRLESQGDRLAPVTAESERAGVLIRLGKYFFYSVDRPAQFDPTAAAEGKRLDEFLATRGDSPVLARQLLESYSACAGEILPDGQWRVIYSTNPAMNGKNLVEDGYLRLDRQARLGFRTLANGDTQRWLLRE